MPPKEAAEKLLKHLVNLHKQVDDRAHRLEVVHQPHLVCGRGCSGCCVDDIRVYAIEAERIRLRHSDLLAEGAPHPQGACAFLDSDGACRIYEDRPYVCRTQGLPLRWHESGDDGTEREFRDICHLNNGVGPVEALAAEDCWPLGPVEERLALLQGHWDDGAFVRVGLRDLFKSSKK